MSSFTGERLRQPRDAALGEEYRGAHLSRSSVAVFISSINRHVRPDLEATRRNNYQRLLGMDLNHGAVDNKPYSYMQAEASNKEFVSTFEELFRASGSASSTPATTAAPSRPMTSKLQDLTKKLNDMLLARRVSGNLSREEFVAVAMMSWFQVTLATNTSIVKDLRADGEERRAATLPIAQQVGVPAHGLSGSYFEIAQDISKILLLIETGIFEGGLGRGCGVVHLWRHREVDAQDHHALVHHHWPRHESRKDCCPEGREPDDRRSRRR